MNILSCFDVKKLEETILVYCFSIFESYGKNIAFIFNEIKYSVIERTFHQKKGLI